MKITINNKDLPYTIDTYGMFNGDSIQENEQDYYAQEYNLTESEQFDLVFDYNHPEIVKALAIESTSLLENNLVLHNETNGIVKSISLPIKTSSPDFYNYTTDSYIATWVIDQSKLKAYTLAHFEEYRLFVTENWTSVYSNVNFTDKTWLEYNYATKKHKTSDMFKNDDVIVSMLDFYLPSVYLVDDYEMSMFEAESNAYYENMTLDNDSKKLIDKKIKELERKQYIADNQTKLL